MSTILQAKSLKKYYTRGSETVRALDGVDFSIGSGEVVSIVGPSGSGKTTLMNLISCLDTATSGQLIVANQDVTRYSESQLIGIRRENIGFVFQQFYLIPTLTARENIELALLFSRKKIDETLLTHTMELVGLQGKENMQVRMLSGGDKQRVSIARAVINNPRLVIADEPTGKLETQIRDCILGLFLQLAAAGIAVFIATHDLALAENTQRIIHLQDGRIVSKEESSLYY